MIQAKNVCFLNGEPFAIQRHGQGEPLGAADFREFRAVSRFAAGLTGESQMRRMEHDNVNRFVGVCVDVAPPLAVWKWCSRGNLQEAITKSALEFDGFFMYSLIRDLASGLAYIHRSPIQLHGHLSALVCLIDDRWQLKISAYGLSGLKEAAPEKNDEQLYKALLWTAPETLRGEVAKSKACDVYAFAIIGAQIISRKSAFDIENRPESAEEIVYAVKKGLSPLTRPDVTIPDDVDLNPAMVHLLRDCWSEHVDDRPSVDTVESLIKAMNSGQKQNLMDHVFQMMEKYAETLEKEVEDRTKQLTEEKKKSDLLLNRMLPKQVAEKLKLGQAVEPESYDMVTIFFCDVVKFTNLAARSSPLQIVNMLNDLYSTFDAVVEKHAVYKVETIGDAYLCVSGLPVRNGKEHVRSIAEMSLDFLDTVKNFRVAHLPQQRIQLRIGMHSGPVVAGVVGLTMPRFGRTSFGPGHFRYCLFGDSVNTASRMESNGKPSMIHLSPDAYKLLSSEFEGYAFEERGDVIIKGKGIMQTYWLLGHEGAAC